MALKNIFDIKGDLDSFPLFFHDIDKDIHESLYLKLEFHSLIYKAINKVRSKEKFYSRFVYYLSNFFNLDEHLSYEQHVLKKIYSEVMDSYFYERNYNNCYQKNDFLCGVLNRDLGKISNLFKNSNKTYRSIYANISNHTK